MTSRVLDLLPEYILGTLSEADRRDVEAALAGSPELRAEAASMADAFGALALALPPAPPAPHVRARLLASIQGPERFMPFARALAGHFDLAVERVQALIRAIDDQLTVWDQGPMPGIELMHFSGGPRVATADVGFVKLPKGLHFPWHRHLGREINYVMQGSLRDYDGKVYGPGEAIIKETGTEHEFFVGDDAGALIAVVVFEGFEIVPEGRP